MKTTKSVKVSAEDRFVFDIDDEELQKMKDGTCPANTLKNNEWATHTFETWRSQRNKRVQGDKCPDNVFDNKDKACKWLCKFVAEVRKSDGSEYTPRSIYLLLAGLQRSIRRSHPKEEINIFSGHEFKELKKVCDAVFKKLHSKGIGSTKKSASVLGPEEEKKLWDTGVLSLSTPTGLLHAVFFYNGKNFCLRGGAEQRNFKISQLHQQTCIVEGKSVGVYEYHEFGSKNRQGGFNSLNVENKVVRQFENTTEGGICHVKILDKYLEKIPADAKEADVFYLTPVSKVTDLSKPWFTRVPVGKNRLNSMMKEMCSQAGLSTDFTNHSLLAYGTTSLFQAHVPEKPIQQRTGHKSLKALRQYERTSDCQLLDVSNVVSNSCGIDATSSVSVESSVSISMPPTTAAAIARCVPHLLPPVSLPVATRKPSHSLLLSGCNFTNCTISFSGNPIASSCENQSRSSPSDIDTTKLFEGISVDELYDD